MTNPELRGEDIAVLEALHNGASTVSEIKEETTLTTRQINYSINEYSLEELGLVEVNRKEGRAWQEINGTEQYVWNPKTIELTDHGIQTLADQETDRHGYEEMSKQELVQRIQKLEQRVDRFEHVFKQFRKKVMDRL
jgi:hypothetical protein